MYKRILENTIKENLFKNKVLILYGGRQVGKTTLVKKIYDEYEGHKVYLQADITSVKENLSNPEPALLRAYFGEAKLIIIDEAQLIANISVVLKVYIDTYPDIQIIATGSSSFDLANKVREPLTGRAIEFMLYPISVQEIIATEGMPNYKSKEELYFKYGMYPGIMALGELEKKNALDILQHNTLYKDILSLENIKYPKVLQDVIKFLAYNIGSVVTSNNIAREVGTTIKTVDRYIDLLQKMFVIIKIYGYSNNKSNEIKKGYKIYFVDIGMRNSIINYFNNLDNRQDNGAIFENYFVMEMIKKAEYTRQIVNTYFWQGDRGLEVDFIEERENTLSAYECKYKERSSKGVKVFEANYPGTKVNIVSKDNYLKYL